MKQIAIGDVHGCLKTLDRLLEKLELTSDTHLVFVGDYVDRGPDSREVIDLLVKEPLPGFESAYLLGNHEAFLLKFVEDDSVGLLWMMNGGEATCRSYGVDLQAWPYRADRMLWLQDELRARIPSAHMAFLDQLSLSHR